MTGVPAHPGGIEALCLNGDGRLLLTGGNDEALRLWQAPELRQARVVSGDPGPVCGVALTGSGQWGASCALRLLLRDMAVQLWDLGAGVQRRLRGPRKNLTCVTLTADGRKVAAGSEDGTVALWTFDPPAARPLTLTGHTGSVTGVAFSPDRRLVYSGGADGTVRRWPIEVGADRTSGRVQLLEPLPR